PLAANVMNLVDARTRRPGGTIPIGSRVQLPEAGADVVFAGRSAWLLLAPQKRVLRIDAASHKLLGSTRLPWAPGERLAAGGGFVWVTEDHNLGPEIAGIDARSGRLTRRLRVDSFAIGPGVAYGAGSLWTTNGAEVLRLNPRTGATEHRLAVVATWI